MEPRDLVTAWDAPDNSKLISKQWSIRLPLHVAAKISALCDLYPRKTKTDIIGDLLATAIDQLVAALPGETLATNGSEGHSGTAIGLRGRFDALTRHYILELEGESKPKGDRAP